MITGYNSTKITYLDVFLLPKHENYKMAGLAFLTILGAGVATSGFMAQNLVLGVLSLTAVLVSGGLLAKIELTRIAKGDVIVENAVANVEKKYHATLKLDNGEMSQYFYERLNKTQTYTFETEDGLVQHEMYFRPSGEPMIVEPEITSLMESNQ